MVRKASRSVNFITDLIRIGKREICAALEVQEAQAAAVMQRVADSVCLEYARADIYIPAGFDPRNRQLVQAYGQPCRGAPAYSPERIEQLAAEYGLTTRQVYGIVASSRKRRDQSPIGECNG